MRLTAAAGRYRFMMLAAGCCSLAVVATGLAQRPPLSPPPAVLISDAASLQMRSKLTRSERILEGLIRRDFDSIARAARELKRISQATRWPYQQDDAFRRLNDEFSRQCDLLDSLATAQNADGVETVFANATLTCIRCHDLIRDVASRTSPAAEGAVRWVQPPRTVPHE